MSVTINGSNTPTAGGVTYGDQVQVQAYIEACLAVKAKYPKPTE